MHNHFPLIALRAQFCVRMAYAVAALLCIVHGPLAWSATYASSTHSAAEQLDVGLPIFDPGIPADASTHSKLGISLKFASPRPSTCP